LILRKITRIIVNARNSILAEAPSKTPLGELTVLPEIALTGFKRSKKGGDKRLE